MNSKRRSISSTWLATAFQRIFVFVGFQGIFAIPPGPTIIAQSPVIPAFNFLIYPECGGATTLGSQTVVPKLADSFSVKVEGKHAEWAFFDSEGYYDKNGQRGATYVHSQGNTTSYLYDFVTGNAFSVTGDDNDYQYNGQTCEKENLWATGCNTYAYFVAEVAGSSNISYNCNFTASNIADQGVQNTTVRAIKVQMWEQCVHDNKQNMTWRNRYYYTAPGVVAPSISSKNPTQTPIRFESLQLDGAAKGNIAMYDFTYYIPEVKDSSVFVPSPGVYCPGWYRGNHSMPSPSSQFTLTTTTLSKTEKSVHKLKMTFNLANGLVSYVSDSANGNHVQSSKNRTLSRTLHDYNSGLSLTMPVDMWHLDRGECTVKPFDDSSQEVTPTSSETIHMRIARELIHLRNPSSWLYVGERDFNDMATHVWATQRTSYAVTTRQNITVTTEAYWLSEMWSAPGENTLIGLITYRTFANGTVVQVCRSTVTDFDTSPFTGGSLKWIVTSATHGSKQHVNDCINADKLDNSVTLRIGM